MQTLSICASKGGVGKSSLTISLAVLAANEGLRVGIIDLDPQQTVHDWWYDRGEPENPDLLFWKIEKLGYQFLPTALERAETELGLDLVIIDTPPAMFDIIEWAVSEADFILIPTQPSPADRHGNQALVQLVLKAQKPFAFVINRVEPRSDKLVPETRRALKPFGPVLTPVIMNRIAFRAALGQGRTGGEIDPKKAGDEVEAVWRAVKRQLKSQARKVA